LLDWRAPVEEQRRLYGAAARRMLLAQRRKDCPSMRRQPPTAP
jgi:hypothetical protein